MIRSNAANRLPFARRALLFLVVLILPAAARLQAGELRFDYVERLSVEDGLAHNIVWDILQDRQGFLWFATGGGLNRYDGYEFKVYLHDSEDPETLSGGHLMDLLEDRQGHLWVGTRNRGLNRFDPSSERFERFLYDPEDANSLLGNRVRALYEDRSGALWVGTYSGLSRWRPDGSGFTRFQHDPKDPQSLAEGLVWALQEDRAGMLWISVWGQGIDRYDPRSGKFFHYRQDLSDPHSLGSNYVSVLYETPDGMLLAEVERRLHRYDQDRDVFVPFETGSAGPAEIDDKHARQTILEDRSGVLWLGKDGGGLDHLERDGPDGKWGTFMNHRHDARVPHSLSSDYILALYEDRTDTVAMPIKPSTPVDSDERLGTDSASAASILVVDDEPINRRVLANHLAAAGYHLREACNGLEALQLLNEIEPDLVLLDVMMPEMSGLEVCRRIRLKYKSHQLPVVFLTAKSQVANLVTGLLNGGNDYLVKPIAKEELLARIRTHLDLRRFHVEMEELVEERMTQIKVLQGFLPICGRCRKVRDDEGYWEDLEIYITEHSEASFSHGMCTDCAREFYPEIMAGQEDTQADG